MVPNRGLCRRGRPPGLPCRSTSQVYLSSLLSRVIIRSTSGLPHRSTSSALGPPSLVQKRNIWHWDRNSYTGVEHVFTLQKLHLFQKIRKIPEALDEIWNLAVSNRDLKPSGTFFRKFACGLGFAGGESNMKKVKFSTGFAVVGSG